jgi:methyl-accepting chemotaxis protein
MATDKLARIETILKESSALPPDKRDELLGLLAQLREETASLGSADPAKAQEIAAQTHALAEQALTQGASPESTSRALSKLSQSVRGFEESHPRLVQVTNAICTALANMGI